MNFLCIVLLSSSVFLFGEARRRAPSLTGEWRLDSTTKVYLIEHSSGGSIEISSEGEHHKAYGKHYKDSDQILVDFMEAMRFGQVGEGFSNIMWNDGQTWSRIIDGVAVLEKFEWPRALRFHLQQELRRKLHGAINKQEHLEPEGLHDDGHNSVLHKKEEPAELDVQVKVEAEDEEIRGVLDGSWSSSLGFSAHIERLSETEILIQSYGKNRWRNIEAKFLGEFSLEAEFRTKTVAGKINQDKTQIEWATVRSGEVWTRQRLNGVWEGSEKLWSLSDDGSKITVIHDEGVLRGKMIGKNSIEMSFSDGKRIGVISEDFSSIMWELGEKWSRRGNSNWGFSINLFLAILTISGIIGAVFYFKYDYAKMIVRHKRSLSSMNVLVNPHIQRLNSQDGTLRRRSVAGTLMTGSAAPKAQPHRRGSALVTLSREGSLSAHYD